MSYLKDILQFCLSLEKFPKNDFLKSKDMTIKKHSYITPQIKVVDRIRSFPGSTVVYDHINVYMIPDMKLEARFVYVLEAGRGDPPQQSDRC